MSDLLDRRETRFVLWCPSAPANPPELVIGQIQNGNPPTFNQLARRPLQNATHAGTPINGLWELDPATLGLADGQTYHYWFEVDNTSPGGSGRIQVTDPLASTVDYRLLAPANQSSSFPASVIGFSGGKLLPRDPNGEQGNPTVAPFTGLAANNQTVIYELPTAWSSFTGSDGFQRAVGTFGDVRALAERDIPGLNFSELRVTQLDPPYLVQLGINALEMLPVADSIYSRQWGYGTSHYLAPDYELGYPEGFLSPTTNRDLTDLVNSLHSRGVRVLLDVVLGFMKEEPYRYIDFDDFYLEDPPKHPGDPDAESSRFSEGKKELRNPFGGSCPRYVKTLTTYDPISGQVKTISPARQHMLTFLTRWMRDFMIDGIRMDSVENVANWDFVEEFTKSAHGLFAARYPAEAAADKYIVVGEELTLPLALLDQRRLDGLWNERFQRFIRAALAGQNAGDEERSFEWTVRRAIDCQIADHLTGAQAVNYLTSHDVEGFRKERLYDQMAHDVPLETSEALFDRGKIEADVLDSIKAEGRDPRPNEVHDRASESILHKARLRRIKLGFVCQLTAVGIPMILAGEEFGDQHDLFDRHGQVNQQGGKQVDPVNYGRFDETDRSGLFTYVANLVNLRTSHPSLAVDETFFFHVDFEEGKRVVAWRRGPTSDPIVVVANFSDYTTPNALSPGAGYVVPHWPDTPPGKHWREVTQNRDLRTGQHNKDSIFAWEAKVYRLVPGDSF